MMTAAIVPNVPLLFTMMTGIHSGRVSWPSVLHSVKSPIVLREDHELSPHFESANIHIAAIPKLSYTTMENLAKLTMTSREKEKGGQPKKLRQL